MKRAYLALALVAGIAGAVTLGASAQPKDSAKKADTKKVETKKVETKSGVGAIEIYKAKAGYRYRVVDAEGKTIGMPTSNKHWETREEVVKAIEVLRETLNKAKPMDVKD
jgi:uncharacterized protein YegP (UPF0339 family)